jgi:hypothetical protein
MATKKKGAPARARRVRVQDETELGGPGDVISALIDRLSPVLLPLLAERLARPAAAPASAHDVNGRLIRMETQVGYLSNGQHGLDNRTKALAAEVEELRQRLAAVERH